MDLYLMFDHEYRQLKVMQTRSEGGHSRTQQNFVRKGNSTQTDPSPSCPFHFNFIDKISAAFWILVAFRLTDPN